MSPADLFSAVETSADSTLILDDVRLYPCEMLVAGQGDLLNWTVEQSAARFPTFTLQPEYPPAVTIATYGYNFELVRVAALALVMGYEIFCEVVVFSQISPVEFDPLADSLARTRRLVTVETGATDFGWGAELIARATARDIRRLKARRVALAAGAPSDHLPVVETILALLGQKSA
jgi:pyruvate/2-oxoglutarate/acetoin dehydrogenase E1 component